MFRPDLAGGFTAGYGIIVKPRYAGERWLLTHEFVHVVQGEEMGIDGLVERYLIEFLTLPGNLIPIEREAIARSEALLGEAAPGYRY